MNQLEQRLRQIALEKELTPTIQDHIVSCGESMSQIILSAYLNEVVSKARQAFNTLQIIGVNVHDQVSKKACKVANVSLTVDDSEGKQSVRVLYSAASLEDGFMSKVEGEENKCPIPVNSSTAASSSGVKRKADGDHPDNSPSVRQQMGDTDRIALQAVEHTLSSDNNDPMPDGGDDVGDQYKIFEDMMNDNVMPVGDSARLSDGVPRIVEKYLQEPIEVDIGGDWACFPGGTSEVEAGQQQGLVEMAEGGRAPRRVLEEAGHQEMTNIRVNISGYPARSAAGVTEVDDYPIAIPMLVGVYDDNDGFQEDVNIDELVGDT